MWIRKKIVRLFLLLLVGSVISCNVQDNKTIIKKLFDLNWKYNYGDNVSAFEIDFDDSEWNGIDLPHKPEKKLDSSGIVWYRKHFEIPQGWSDKSISIYFEGISSPYELYVNGIFIENLPAEKTSFQARLDPYLNSGGRSVVAIRIALPEGKNDPVQTEIGIFKHVWLIVKNSPEFKRN